MPAAIGDHLSCGSPLVSPRSPRSLRHAASWWRMQRVSTRSNDDDDDEDDGGAVVASFRMETEVGETTMTTVIPAAPLLCHPMTRVVCSNLDSLPRDRKMARNV
jgi:hypothetical protein